MRTRHVLLGLIVLLLPAAAAAAGKCDVGGVHGAAVVAARALVREHCDCAAATGHARYVECAWRVAQQLAADGALPRMCRGRVRQYASRSTCGRDDVVACCVKHGSASWRPVLRDVARGCGIRRADIWCEAALPHLDDACDPGGGCRQSQCGDGILDRRNGEACEPRGVGLCDAWCQVIVCGNGALDPGEDCEPPNTPTCDHVCRTRHCGDGVVNPDNEQCEPPNTPSCNANCLFDHRCGNGVVDASWGEECEPPGAGPCDASCQYVHRCGNRVVELGEECDGQPQCDPSCKLVRTQCCQLGEWCFDGVATDIVGEYFFAKGCGYTLGGTTSSGVCEGADACPDPVPPELGCRLGSCTDEPIDPLPLCCQHADGTCTGSIATTTGSVGGCGWGTFPPPQQGDFERLIVGTCGADGRCVPGG
jgi:hypothetical protein